MAKKILSILCALAMMVTMVSVAAFSASAAEPVAMGNITGSNWEKWAAVETGTHGQSGYYNTPTAGDSIWAMAANTNVKLTSTIGTYNVSDAYTLALDMFYVSGKNGRTRFEITIGDLVLTFVSDASHNLAGSATYDGTAVTFNNDLYLDWNCYSNVTPQTMQSEVQAAITAAGSEPCFLTTDNAGYLMNKKTNINVTLEDGTLTVVSKTKTCTANLTAAGYDKTADLGETEVKLAVEINKEGPGYVVGALGNFSGTYAAATTGGEGGETPDPEVPTGDVNFNLLDSKNITGWTLTRSSPNSSGPYNFAGNIDLTSLELNGITGTLVQTQANHVTYTDVTFDYNNGVSAIDFGENFSVLMTAYMNAQPAGLATPDKDAYVSLKLGDYSVRLVHFVEDAANDTAWNERDSFRIAIYYGETLVAVSDVIDRSVTTSLYNGYVSSSNADAWKNTGTYGGYIKSKSLSAQLLPASGGTSFNGDNSWKDVKIVVNDNKMTINTVAGVCGLHVLSGSDSADDVTTLSGFNTTALDIAEGTSFDGIVPQVVVAADKTLRKMTAVGVFRLEGTIYAPEDPGDSTEPLAPTGVYPTLNSDLTLNVIYANAADYKDTVKVTATVEGMSPKTVGLTEKDGYLVASFDFLTPDKFGSEITLNAVDTNGIAESYSTTYSVKQYCKNMMDKDSSSAELKALCMALLQFGDSYAVYKNGSTFLSDMSSYVTAYAPTAWTQGTAAWTYTGTANGAEWVGANLNFAGEIGINVNFKADGDASDYTVDASFGTVSDVIVDGDTFMATIRISSSFLSNQNEVTVMSADGVISEVFTLSVEDWVNANIGKMEDAKTKAFVIALMTYGDAAAAYRN